MAHKRKGLQWAGLVIGILGAGWLILFVWSLVFQTLDRLPEPIAWLDTVASTLVIFGSIYIAWKRGLIGAMILFIATISVSGANSIISIGTEFYELGILFFSVPATVLLIISGVLFSLSGRGKQKQQDSEITKQDSNTSPV